MATVAIVTDSMSSVPKNLVDDYGIFLAPSTVIIGNQVYQDLLDISPSEVYERQRKDKILPTTSAPSPGEHLEIYRKAAQNADSILHISIAPSLTMAYESALKAKEMAKEEMPNIRIEVIDSKTAAGAQSFMTLAAAKVAAAGGNLDEAINAVNELIPKVQLYCTLDTLYFLAKSGRVPRVAAWTTSLLSIKPILQISNGESTPVERVRSRQKATNRLVEIMKEKTDGKPVHVNLMHAGVPEEAEELRNKVAVQFDCLELYVTEFSPVMGSHTGPGLLGLAFYA